MRGPWQFITCEYPPLVGGVSDFSRSLAHALVRCGEHVEIWTPGTHTAGDSNDGGITVRRIGGFDAQGLRQVSEDLAARAGDHHLFVHWVPHGYGARGMNVGFCRWVAARAAGGDRVTVMVHEPYLPLPPARLRHLPIALAQRYMMRLLLECASRVCVSTTAWLPMLARHGLRAEHAVIDLPIASSVAPVDAPEDAAALAARLRSARGLLIGHFAGFGGGPPLLLSEVAARLIARRPDTVLVLIGRDSDRAAAALVRTHSLPPGTIVGSGTVTAGQISRFIHACDLFVQPYSDGATTRRSTLATLLAHGAPVVTTVGPLTEPEWQSDPLPVVTSSVEPDAIADAVTWLAGDPAARLELSCRARARYAARFDIDTTARRLLAA